MTDQTDRSEGVALAKVSSLDEKKAVDGVYGKPDEFIPNSENVTQHEYDTLHHIGDSLPLSAFLVAIVEFAERYGMHFHYQYPFSDRSIPF
jgi:POT family proton-dependent oligopeptide transporter